jgi:hypothetical protein
MLANMLSLLSRGTVEALGAGLLLAACATVGSSPRRSSDPPSPRCLNEPGRGESPDPTRGEWRGQSPSQTRPLFFFFCVQAP